MEREQKEQIINRHIRRKPGLKLGDQFQREGQKPRYEVEKGEEHEAGRKDEVTDGKAEDNR